MRDSASRYGSTKRDSSVRVQPQRKKSVQQKAQERKTRVYGGFRLVRRLLVLTAALWYIFVSVDAATHSMLLLRGTVDRTVETTPFLFTLIPHYVGKTTVRLSPLVVDVLGNSTAPRNDSLFLQSEDRVSFTDWGPDVTTFDTWTYDNAYMRQNLVDLTADTSHNLPFLANSELIVSILSYFEVPVVET